MRVKKWLLLIAIVLAGSHARAQGTRDTLTLNLDKALEIALSDNPTIKVAEEEIALKKVSRKETWQNLLPEASITGSMSHTITAPQFSIGDQIVKMGQDKANTAAGTLNISLPLFAPSVYRAMSMTKTDIELAVEKSRASKLDLVNQVTKAYYQLMLSQDSYEVLQKSYELAEENYHMLKNSKMIGGRPDNTTLGSASSSEASAEAYGFSCFDGKEGIISLRNPSASADKEIKFTFDRTIGVAEGAGTLDYYLEHSYKLSDESAQTGTLTYGQEYTVNLKPNEVRILRVSAQKDTKAPEIDRIMTDVIVKLR